MTPFVCNELCEAEVRSTYLHETHVNVASKLRKLDWGLNCNDYTIMTSHVALDTHVCLKVAEGEVRVGATQPPTSTGSPIVGHHLNGRLTSPGPPHLSSAARFVSFSAHCRMGYAPIFGH
ncbi:hypothetical protein KIN20_000126 [Parelaphostrongylus tenuis]|uniref:Uncharacterized protein n=1 Tax=Parelaphostrongylus tenuis TaxID=148309 RepID=A0AAD5MAW1_PARTN|nr:hypothetical protein KIN20_000126 [Parelaphostrongylus tenuis]